MAHCGAVAPDILPGAARLAGGKGEGAVEPADHVAARAEALGSFDDLGDILHAADLLLLEGHLHVVGHAVVRHLDLLVLFVVALDGVDELAEDV